MNNGDYTFYGMIVSDNESLAKTVEPQDGDALPLLNMVERKAVAGKIKKVLHKDLR